MEIYHCRLHCRIFMHPDIVTFLPFLNCFDAIYSVHSRKRQHTYEYRYGHTNICGDAIWYIERSSESGTKWEESHYNKLCAFGKILENSRKAWFPFRIPSIERIREGTEQSENKEKKTKRNELKRYLVLWQQHRSYANVYNIHIRVFILVLCYKNYIYSYVLYIWDYLQFLLLSYSTIVANSAFHRTEVSNETMGFHDSNLISCDGQNVFAWNEKNYTNMWMSVRCVKCFIDVKKKGTLYRSILFHWLIYISHTIGQCEVADILFACMCDVNQLDVCWMLWPTAIEYVVRVHSTGIL